MPAKYKPSEKRVDRETKKVTVIHYYAKQLSNEKLFELINDDKTKPKHKQKFRNIIQGRGTKIVKVARG
jgi:HD superfamily phosphohydrolase YqeK|tara:strand:+ start:2379 stop:2585 length:207 start_codon:yes stop_codon:yes gene_type:complete